MSNDDDKTIRNAIVVLAFPEIVALAIVFVGNVMQKMTGKRLHRGDISVRRARAHQ